MSRILYFLLFSLPSLFLQAGAYAQDLQGFYTGQMKISGSNVKLGVQLDLMYESGKYTAVLRSRVVEGQTVSGCDNWLEGTLNEGNLNLVNLLALRATNVPPGACMGYRYAKFSIKAENGGYSLSGNLNDLGGDFYAKLTLTRVDTANSFSVSEEAEQAKKGKGELEIANTFTDSARIEKMIEVRGIEWLDTLAIREKNSSLKIEAPGADMFHKLTILINGNPVLINSTPRQQGAIIRLKEMVPGDMEVVLLCYHVLVEVTYDVKLTLTWEGGEKTWMVPVSTNRNAGIMLQVKETGKGQ